MKEPEKFTAIFIQICELNMLQTLALKSVYSQTIYATLDEYADDLLSYNMSQLKKLCVQILKNARKWMKHLQSEQQDPSWKNEHP